MPKEENEIQSYINSFKEMEEPEEPGQSGSKVYIEETEITTSEAILEEDENKEDYRYVFIVQDDEDCIDEKMQGDEQEIFEFEDYEEEAIMLDESENKSKVGKSATKKRASGSQSMSHVCSFCNYSTNKRYLLARHMKCHSEDRPHKCSVCERGFKTMASLTNHVNTHTGVKPHTCKFCEAAFTTSGELVRHVRYRHTHEKPHKCPECDYASVELSKLKRHIRCHTGERPYQCPHCTYASPDTFKLKRHLRIHTGEKPYLCEICQARFTQSNSLKAHKLIHSVGEKPVFQCELCPTTCGRKTDLRIHVQKLHTSDVPIKCKRCNQVFSDRYSYKIHAKTHEGEKSYRCEMCPYASISARHLESHMLIHTDEKPFECSNCDQTFRQKQLLKRHENLYHNPNYIAAVPKEKTHLCPTCKKAFRHKGNLIRHMLQHEAGTSRTSDTDEEKPKIKGEPLEDGNSGSNYVVVEVINEEIEYDDGEYELDSEVEVDGTGTFKLSEDDNDAFVTGLEFEGDEVSTKN